MDFIDWSSLVLRRLAEISKTTENAWYIGVDLYSLAEDLFPDEDWQQTTRQDGLLEAINELSNANLVAKKSIPAGGYGVTRFGREIASDLTPLWERICSRNLEGSEEFLLQVVNRLSSHDSEDHAWLETVEEELVFAQTEWNDESQLWPILKELEQLGFIVDSDSGLRATYPGLVWETRRGLTMESKRIDALIKEWETTSVDFKRELYIDTADQKAEFVKDILGLVNTQASGRRLLIIGFDEKSRSYHGPPNPNVNQNMIEQLLSRGTSPMVDIRYELIDYRSGTVGQVEVFRDPRKLPYRVAVREGSKGREKGGKRLIEEGQIFVRHGSQTEEPTPGELQALIDEGNRASPEQEQ